MMEYEHIRIVLVDDHQLVRETWKMVLQTSGDIIIVGECASGTEALELVPRLLPDIVLMDINMSPVNGFETTRLMLQDHPGIRIIGVSVNNQPGYARNMLQLGARGYVTKNSSRDEMIRAIRQVFRGQTYICEEVMQKMGDDK